MGHKTPTNWLLYALGAVVLLAAIAPTLILLSDALLPLVLVVGALAIVGRLVYFHTRRW